MPVTGAMGIDLMMYVLLHSDWYTVSAQYMVI